jgi:Icc-related predicted phosphoesterase
VKLAHFSDLHGNFEHLHGVPTPDIWVCSGDFFPNFVNPYAPIAQRVATERHEQKVWWDSILPNLVAALRGQPVVWVGGNHDYIVPTGIPNLHVLFDGNSVELLGLKFSGFSEVLPTGQNWNGEVSELQMSALCSRALSHNPDVLVTHSPPHKILDSTWGGSFGSNSIKEHVVGSGVKLHCFGHIHQCGGRQVEVERTLFSNAATTCVMLDLNTPVAGP